MADNNGDLPNNIDDYINSTNNNNNNDNNNKNNDDNNDNDNDNDNNYDGNDENNNNDTNLLKFFSFVMKLFKNIEVFMSVSVTVGALIMEGDKRRETCGL